MKRPAVVVAMGLVLLTVCLVAYRVYFLGYPLLPSAPGQTWNVSIDVRLKEGATPFSLKLGLPSEIDGRLVVEEKISSGTLGFSLLREDGNRMGLWWGVGDGRDVLVTYMAVILERPTGLGQPKSPSLPPFPPSLGNYEKILAERVGAKFRGLLPVPRLRAIGEAMAGKWGDYKPDNRDFEEWSVFTEKRGKVMAFLALLRATGLPAREARGIILGDTVTNEVMNWVEAWTGLSWEKVRIDTGEVYGPRVFLLPLSTGGVPVVQTAGAQVSEVRWTSSKEMVSRWRLHAERVTRSSRFLDRWSLFRLPPDFQETFRILLLVPLGALLICVLRNIIGFPTFGIFMPVLMALAFRNMGLVFGLAVFFGVVFIGYGVRKVLDRLHLLLVPRMSVLLTLVIACFTVLALIGSKIGMREFMAVGLLPFVILAMTIERFFIVVEESGAREGFVTSVGSAVVALITYEIISWDPLQLTFFVYPELMAATAAAQILIGRYTGYRLSEFIRFRPFRKDYDF